MIPPLALLTTALLFGGMVLYSFGFAAFRFTTLPADVAPGPGPAPPLRYTWPPPDRARPR
jgi:hypothetical protein